MNLNPTKCRPIKLEVCLCFRSDQKDKVLLVNSSFYQGQRIVPGGVIEPEEESGGTAVREGDWSERKITLLGRFKQNLD
jgi:diphosphoinositol-polyphosphate diphosphatase